MKKNIIVRLSLILSLFSCTLFTGCTKNFENINADPIRPSKANQGNMLGQVEYQLVNATISTSKEFSHELMQVTAPRESSSGGTHRYVILQQDGSSIWNSVYARLTDLNDLQKSSQGSFPNYQAIAMILKAWSFSILTDAFGPVPFSESGLAEEGNVTPKFDQQKEIYTGILALLKEANELIEPAAGLQFGGDLIYGENEAAVLRWKKFANSLRLRLLLRIINRDGDLDVKGEIQTMLADKSKYPLFDSNADGAILRYTGSYPYYNPYYNARTLDWRQGDYYTKFFLDPLVATGDPRVAAWATQVDIGGKLTYSGIESGYTSDIVYVTDKNSSYNDALKTSPLLGQIMSYAELEFILSELALRGFQTGNTPKQHYDKGVVAAIQQWGGTVATSFVEQQGIRYNTALDFEGQLAQIIGQKYYALYFADMQSWFEKKRTGYPVLPRGNGIPVENKFPSRLIYPTYLQSLNPHNLEDAVTSLGGRDVSTVVGWWEKK